MTTPGNPTGPAENNESQKGQPVKVLDEADQIMEVKKLCDVVKKEQPKALKEYVEKKSPDARDKLKNALVKKIQNPEIQKLFNIKNQSDVEKFLEDNGCIENQLFGPIDDNYVLREKVKHEIIEETLDQIATRYPSLTFAQRGLLEKELRGEDKISYIRSILENHRTQKSFIKRILTVDLTLPSIDIDFDSISEKIIKLDPTRQNVKKIQDAWVKIASLANPGETLKEAFQRVQSEGPVDFTIAGAYKTFFGSENTCLSTEEKTTIRKYLVTNFVPLIPYNALHAIAPNFAENLRNTKIGSERKVEDAEDFKQGTKRYRDERYNASLKHTLQEEYCLAVDKLPEDMQIYLLGRFGNIGRSEKLLQYAKGVPNSLRTGSQDYKENFRSIYGFYPAKIETQENLEEELISKLGNKLENIENFRAGNVLEYHTLGKDKEPIIGYFWIDETMSNKGDDIAEDNLIKVRWLGNDKAPLSQTGQERRYTGADFFHYLVNCGEDGKLIFKNGESFMSEMKKEEGLPRFETDEEVVQNLRESLPENNEQMSVDTFQFRADQKFREFSGNEKKEGKLSKEAGALQEGSMIAHTMPGGGTDIMHVTEINEEEGTITLWDGWGKKIGTDPKTKSMITITFGQFLEMMDQKKNMGASLTRITSGKKQFSVDDFNNLIGNSSFNEEFQNKISQVRIHKEQDGKLKFGKYTPGESFSEMPILKIKGKDGKPRDIWIKNIDEMTGSVDVMIGKFTNNEFDSKTGKKTQESTFRGRKMKMPLVNLWAYIYSNNNFQFEKQKKPPRPQEEEKPMSWFNIFAHAHSLGVLLHGDLWKAPMKAWEEQHHKEHAFHGKLTAALAIEKLRGGKGPVGGFLSWVDWPSFMVAESNNSFQTYLDELVQRIDGMGSTNRAKLIVKWSKHHFPDLKFMAAMLGSLQVFGQLYPRDGQFGDDPRAGKPWYYYNSIIHSLGRHDYMPPQHGHGKDIPDDKTEMQMIVELMAGFKHPIMTDLKRRFEKYMAKGFENNKGGGVGNLKQRERMEDQYDWMLSSAIGNSREVEMLGHDTSKVWFEKGYDITTTTGPGMAFLLSGGEQKIPPQMQEDLEDQFKNQSIKHPAFLFAKSKMHGDIFRDICTTFAYTISDDCGGRIKDLCAISKDQGRLHGKKKTQWLKDFKAFWEEYGAELMEKITGMKDPMFQVMMTDEKLFNNELLPKLPPSKKAQYARLGDSEHRYNIKRYFERMKEFNSSSHYAGIKGSNGAFYAGDHFRFRPDFPSGWPMFWMDWNGYFDANEMPNYFSNQYKSDGVYKEMRAFIGAIPRLAETMVDNMGITGSDRMDMINKVAKSIYERNIPLIKNEVNDLTKKKGTDQAYACVPAWILGFADLDRFTPGASATPKEMARIEGYEAVMKKIIDTAKWKEKNEGFAEAIRYRERMWPKCLEIIRQAGNPTDMLSGQEGEVSGIKKRTGKKVVDTMSQKEIDNVTMDPDDFFRQATANGTHGAETLQQDHLNNRKQGSQGRGDDDDTNPLMPKNSQRQKSESDDLVMSA